MNVAIIPARGGSKRIPRKNLKHFCGQPILYWPIKTVLDSGFFDRVIVSTDDDEIADLALAKGAEVPFYRPAELANDYTATVPVIRHAINSLKLDASDVVCCIYPTAVFTRAEDLIKAITLLLATSADFVMPVRQFDCPLDRALQLDSAGKLSFLHPQNENKRTQDCETNYHDVGQYYIGRAAAWLKDKPFYAQDVRALLTSKYLAHDIDTPEDWFYAELMFNSIGKF